MDFPIVPIAAFVAFFILMVLLARHQAKKRREAIQAAAAELGLTYQAELWSGDQSMLLGRLGDMHPFGRGDRPKIYNRMSGARNGLKWDIFDYEYTTTDRDSDGHETTTTHRYGLVVAEGNVDFPDLRLEGEGAFAKLASALGFKDIQFEYEAFNKRYKVNSPDAKRTHDLIYPKSMEYLMAIPVRNWQFRRNLTVIVVNEPVEVAAIPGLMKEIEGFLALIPPYYRQDNPA